MMKFGRDSTLGQTNRGLQFRVQHFRETNTSELYHLG